MPQLTKIQLRRDTTTNWSNVNPVLAQGEMGYATNTNMVKVGDGVTAWNSLPFLTFATPTSAVSLRINNGANVVYATSNGVISTNIACSGAAFTEIPVDNTLLMNGSLSGSSGTFDVYGGGTYIANAASTYSGTMRLNAANVYVQADDGLGTGPVQVNNGANVFFSNVNYTASGSQTWSSTNGGNVTVYANSNVDFNSSFPTMAILNLGNVYTTTTGAVSLLSGSNGMANINGSTSGMTGCGTVNINVPQTNTSAQFLTSGGPVRTTYNFLSGTSSIYRVGGLDSASAPNMNFASGVTVNQSSSQNTPNMYYQDITGPGYFNAAGTGVTVNYLHGTYTNGNCRFTGNVVVYPGSLASGVVTATNSILVQPQYQVVTYTALSAQNTLMTNGGNIDFRGSIGGNFSITNGGTFGIDSTVSGNVYVGAGCAIQAGYWQQSACQQLTFAAADSTMSCIIPWNRPYSINCTTLNAPSGFRVSFPSFPWQMSGFTGGTFTILTKTGGYSGVPTLGTNNSGRSASLAWVGNQLQVTFT